MGVGDLRLNFVSLLSDIFVEKGTSEDLTVLKEKKTLFYQYFQFCGGFYGKIMKEVVYFEQNRDYQSKFSKRGIVKYFLKMKPRATLASQWILIIVLAN